MVWETGVQSQVELYQRLKKWYFMLACLTLSITRYGSREQELLYSPLHLGALADEKGAFWLPSTTVAKFTYINIMKNIQKIENDI